MREDVTSVVISIFTFVKFLLYSHGLFCDTAHSRGGRYQYELRRFNTRRHKYIWALVSVQLFSVAVAAFVRFLRLRFTKVKRYRNVILTPIFLTDGAIWQRNETDC